MFGQAFLPDSSYQHCLYGPHLLLSPPLILEEALSIHVLPSDPSRKLKLSCPTPAGVVYFCVSQSIKRVQKPTAGGVGPAEKISFLLNSVLAGRGVLVPGKVLLNPSLAGVVP